MSEEIKSHSIRVEDIPANAEVELTQNSKPYASLVVLMVLCAGLIWFSQTRIFGVIFLVAVILLWRYSPNRRLVTVTDKFIVAHESDGVNCRIYYYDEVAQWDLNHLGGSDVIVLYLTDGSMTSVPVLYVFPVQRRMRKFMKDKEKIHLQKVNLVDHSPRVKKKKKNKKKK